MFMAADDMIKHGLNNKDVRILSNTYNPERAKKMFQDTYAKINLPSRYDAIKQESGGGKFGFGKSAASSSNSELSKMLANPQIEDMICKSEWLWHQFEEKGNDKPTEEEVTYSVACLIKVVETLIVRKDNIAADTAPNKNKKVIITKTGKVIELSDESDDKPVNSKGNEPSVIEHIRNIDNFLRVRSKENAEYVKAYIEDWVALLMQNKFDKDSLLSLFDADEVRTKTLQTIKKLSMDMVTL